jgi:hypothetical protein
MSLDLLSGFTIDAIVKSNKNIEVLQLQDCRGIESKAILMLQRLKKLRSLNVKHCKQLFRTDLVALMTACQFDTLVLPHKDMEV